MKDECRRVEDLVLDILEHDADARNSDDYLYFKVCQRLDSAVLGATLGNVLNNFNRYDVPRYSTVSRARRKVQAKFKHLRAADKVADNRLEREIMFEDYAKEVR